MTVLSLLLVFHGSDGELDRVHYLYGGFKKQKADEQADIVVLSLIFTTLTMKSV